jgi:hypothetical protein
VEGAIGNGAKREYWQRKRFVSGSSDLAVAKLAAGREKDCSFVASLLRNKLADATLVESRLRKSPLKGKKLDLAVARLKRLSRH